MTRTDPEATVARARRRVIRALTEAGATSPDTATDYRPAEGIDARQLAKLRHTGAVITILDGRVWLDQGVLAVLDRKARNRTAMGVGAGVAAVAAVAGAVLWFRRRSGRDGEA